jgi:hypothetical protein
MSEYSGNLNDITKNCCCRIAPGATNNPLPNLGQYSQYGFLICFCNYSADGNRTMYQVVGNYILSVGDLYLRGGREGPIWSTWKKITLSARFYI